METIDKTQFLPRRTSIVNAFRSAKGDLDGKVESRKVEGKDVLIVTHAQVRDATILAELIERGFLEDHHKMYGFVFMELHRAYLAPLSHKMNCVFLEFMLGGEVSSSTAARMYAEVIRDFKLDNARIVEYACDSPAEDDAALKVIAGINVYMDTFELLVKLLDQAREKIKAENEKGLANG